MGKYGQIAPLPCLGPTHGVECFGTMGIVVASGGRLGRGWPGGYKSASETGSPWCLNAAGQGRSSKLVRLFAALRHWPRTCGLGKVLLAAQLLLLCWKKTPRAGPGPGTSTGLCGQMPPGRCPSEIRFASAGDRRSGRFPGRL